MKEVKAFLFDLNGTMINDMVYHIRAWCHILNNLGAVLSYEQVKSECYGKNDELIERIFPGRFSDIEKKRMGIEKEKKYQEDFKPHLKLINGLDDFLARANQEGIKMGIGSAAIMFNINFVLDNLSLGHYFHALVSADDVSYSKPNPETFLKCAERLEVEPGECIVFEDAPKGVESALNAGMKCIVLTILHEQDEFAQYPNIVKFVKDYNDPFFNSFFNEKLRTATSN